jgi:hypothetical protein
MKRSTKILIIISILGITVFVAYDQIHRWHKNSLRSALEQERNEWWDNIGKLEEKVANLEEELAQEREAIVPKEKLVEVFGEESTVLSPEEKVIDCAELESQVTAFFAYLDDKEYIKSCGLEGGTYSLLQQSVRLLSESLPMVAGETMDLYSLTRNVAHFYRILGMERIDIVKNVMRNEAEIIESVIATMFAWFNSCNQCKETQLECPSLEVSYEYAAFFLNTLAGKSYLLRRDSKLRILTSYYCVLILDRANEETLNRHGVDIRPYIDFSFRDIRNQKRLIYQSRYQRKLQNLRKKYQLNDEVL